MNKALHDELVNTLKRNNKIQPKAVIKKLLSMTPCKRDIAFWPNAQIVYALSVADKKDPVVIEQVKKWRAKKFNIIENDDILMAYVLATKTNFLTKNDVDIIYTNIVNRIGNFRNKLVPYRFANPNMVYIDLLGMLPQMLIYLGIERNDSAMVKWGVDQFTEYVEKSTDNSTKLPYHAYDMLNDKKMGIIGWGRSLGWIMMGLSESIVCLGDKYNTEKQELVTIYKNYLESIAKYQREDGGFSWQLQAIDGPLDSSATAMILQSMLILKNILSNSDRAMAHNMIKCLDGCVADGKVLHCSAECGGVGIYPQKYSSYAWSIAPYAICKELEKEI